MHGGAGVRVPHAWKSNIHINLVTIEHVKTC